jgi:hypothetical protein
VLVQLRADFYIVQLAREDGNRIEDACDGDGGPVQIIAVVKVQIDELAALLRIGGYWIFISWSSVQESSPGGWTFCTEMRCDLAISVHRHMFFAD